MKKLFLLLPGVIMTAVVSAQVSWGIKTGLNITNMIDSPYSNMKTGLYFGAWGEWRPNDVFAIQPELLYSAQGGSKVTTSNEITTRARIRANYVLLPVLAKFYVTDDFSIELGPQAGYILTAKRYTKIIDNTDSRAVVTSKYRINSSEYRPFDFSVSAGLSYRLTRGFSVSARYSYGITTFSKTKDWRNSVIQVGFASKIM